MPQCLPIGNNPSIAYSGSPAIYFLNSLKGASFWRVDGGKNSTVTINNNNPSAATITWTGHGLSAGACFTLTTTGTFPIESTSGLAMNTATIWSGWTEISYYVTAVVDANTFRFTAVSRTNADIIVTSSGSGTVTADCGNIDNMNLNSDGYPQSMVLTNGAGTATGFTLIAFRSLQQGTASTLYNPGNYVFLYTASSLTYDLTGSIDFTVTNTSAGRDIWNVTTPSTQGLLFKITACSGLTNLAVIWSPDSTSGFVGTNEQKYLNGLSDPYNGPIYHDFYLNQVGFYHCHRNMARQLTVNDGTVNWSDRATLTYYTWSNDPASGTFENYKKHVGAPLEICINLSNVLNVDGWFNVPFLASTSYITSFADMIRDNLKPKAYIEYGNEMWNQGSINGNVDGTGRFVNTVYAIEPYNTMCITGHANFPGAGSFVPANYFAFFFDQSCYMFTVTADTCATEFAGQLNRLVRVAGGQSGNNGRNANILQYHTPVDGNTVNWTGTVGSHLDAFATAPYVFSYDVPEAWTDTTTFPDGGVALGLQEMSLGGAIPNSLTGVLTPGGTASAFTATTGHGYTGGTIPNGTFIVVDFNAFNPGNSAGSTIAVDSIGALGMCDNYGNSIPAHWLGTTGVASARYGALYYCNRTSAGAVSPAQWRLANNIFTVSGSDNMWGGYPGGMASESADFWLADSNLAIGTYAIRSIGYEAGQHFSPGSPSILGVLYDAMNLNSGMQAAYNTYFNKQFAKNNDLICHLTDVALQSQTQMFGAKVNLLESTSPKFAALQDLGSCPIITSQQPGPRSRRVVHYHHVAGT